MKDLVGDVAGRGLFANAPLDLGDQLVVQLVPLSQHDEERHPVLPVLARDVHDERVDDLRDGAELDDDLIAEIKRRIREQTSPRHVPNEVFQIAEVPRTLSGKVLEVPVKRILMGEAPERAASRDSLANPTSLDYFTDLARRR